ncbi:uncharacterized protein LOC131858751 [Cryptomeria japonica]|uniref:uncharacterized protein LOC131858751 n=1 Tax=Cryptomeria japonica TaxID=3369 RepID=UPI0027DA13FA|nr:uncharacterized protein LOC131858751 [Cryptomeria japonica]
MTADWKNSCCPLNRRIKRKCRESLGQFPVMPFSRLHQKRSFLPKCNKQWYFLSPCHRKYPSGSLANRATEAGADLHVEKKLKKEFKIGAGLQNAFVLCHVLKKNELPEKSGGLQSAEIEKCDSSPKNRNPSCDEDKSEDRSKQLEEVQIYSSLPNIAEDTAGPNMWLGPGKDTINQQVDSMANGLRSNCEFGWLPSNNNEFPQVPADISFTRPEATDGHLTGEEMDEYIDEANIMEEILRACQDSQNSNMDHSFPQDSYADISNGNYIELNDFENCGSSLSFDSVFNNGSPEIQLRPRSPALHSYQHDVSSEGTYKRRVRIKLSIKLKLQQDQMKNL